MGKKTKKIKIRGLNSAIFKDSRGLLLPPAILGKVIPVATLLASGSCKVECIHLIRWHEKY